MTTQQLSLWEYRNDDKDYFYYSFIKWREQLGDKGNRLCFVLSISLKIQEDAIRAKITYSSNTLLGSCLVHKRQVIAIFDNNSNSGEAENPEIFFEKVSQSTTNTEDEADYYEVLNLLQDPATIYEYECQQQPTPTSLECQQHTPTSLEAWDKLIDMISPQTASNYVLK
jgi:hypothetical protein